MVPELRDPGYERLGPIGYVVKAGRRETIRRIQNLKVNLSQYHTSNLPHGAIQVTEKDVWIVTYPRSGTTWTQEMVRLLFSLTELHQSSDLSTQIWQILNGLDFEGGSKIDIDKKFFFLDMDWLAPKGITENITACEEALGMICSPTSLFIRNRAIS